MQSQSTMSSQNLLAENFSRMTNGGARNEGCTGDLHAANAVVHRQAVVYPVFRLRAHHAGEPIAPLHHASMANDGSLRQASRAGGVNIQGTICDVH